MSGWPTCRTPGLPRSASRRTPEHFRPWKRKTGASVKRRKNGEYTWFSVICDLINRYDNIYADISATLHEERTHPLLKVLLETNPKLRERILFGTDFYMVSLSKSEKELSLGLRGYLGEELFHQIAVTNVETFLSSRFNP